MKRGRLQTEHENAGSSSAPNQDPADERYDDKRHWRAPAWLIINYMITNGLKKGGFDALVERGETASLKLIDDSGFAEYYDPITRELCDDTTFTGTTAMVM